MLLNFVLKFWGKLLSKSVQKYWNMPMAKSQIVAKNISSYRIRSYKQKMLRNFMLKLILTLRILCGLWAYNCTDTGLPANKPVKGTLIFIHKIFINGPTLASSFSVFSKKTIYFFTTNRCGKCHVHPVYSTRIRTHDLSNISRLP